MDFRDDVQLNRLSKAVEHSYRSLEPFRNLYRGLAEEYAGSGYGRGGKQRYEILVNLMNQVVDAYTMSLAANRPRVMLSTKKANLRAFASHFETAINNLIAEIKLEEVLRAGVLDAFFCVGISKVHLADSVPVMLEEGLWMDPGTPFVSRVGLDNWVHDCSVSEWHKVRFAGDSYRLPFEQVKSEAGGMFDADVVEGLAPTSKIHNDDQDRLERISQGTEVDPDELEPMIDVIDLWVPKDRKIYTFALDRGFSLRKRPLAAMGTPDPDEGPYHRLSFNDVPENIMPTSPAMHLAAMSRLVNSIFRKQAKRAKSHKKVHAYPPGAADDAANLQRANDDEFRMVTDPRELNTIEIGGIDPNSQAFMLGVVEMFDRMAGNLTAMMGLGAQAETVGQEQLIHSAVSKKEAQMQYRTLGYASGICRSLGRLLWEDEVKMIPGELQVEGTDIRVDSTWYPGDREGQFNDYDLDIDVYSMPYQSPSQRAQALNNLLMQIYIPGAQLLAMQGGSINLQALAEIHADLLNMPRLKEVIQFNAPPAEMMGEEEGPGLAPATTRNYVRRNVPTAGTVQGRQHVAQQAWIDQAGQVNGQQRNAM